MDATYAAIAIVLVVALIGVGLWVKARKKAFSAPLHSAQLPQAVGASTPAGSLAVRAQEYLSPQQEIARRIVVMTSASQSAFELTMISDDAEFNRGRPLLRKGGLGAMGRIGACLQAAPGLMVQQGHQGRQLMEVLINNPLSNAADGVHLRAFARGADGKIIEHAKLLNPKGLSSLVNAAAVWQVASVVVAQKHLADISAKLDDIKQGIDDLKGIHEDGLDGDVMGTYHYLQGVAQTLEKGEVPKFARVELEACRRELLQISSSLIKMFSRRMAKSIEHRETLGTGDLLAASLERYTDLNRIHASLTTCFKTQALCWHVLSLFPDEEVTADLWKQQTLSSTASFEKLASQVTVVANTDAERFKSWFNFGSTLEERRQEVRQKAQQTRQAIAVTTADFDSDISRTARLLEHNNDTIKLGIELSDGAVQQIRILEGATLPGYENEPVQRRLREISESNSDQEKSK